MVVEFGVFGWRSLSLVDHGLLLLSTTYFGMRRMGDDET